MIDSHDFHYLLENVLSRYQESFKKILASEEQIFISACIQQTYIVAYKIQEEVLSPKATKAPIQKGARQTHRNISRMTRDTPSPFLKCFGNVKRIDFYMMTNR